VNGPLRILYAGSLCLRKGIPYFMKVAEKLSGENQRFRAVGPIQVSEQACEQLRRRIVVVGSVSRPEMAQEYDNADVLVFATISEGSANVCYEALAAGLPVITTPHAGSIVRDGLDGYIVPIRDIETLAARIAFLARDRDKLAEMSANAVSQAARFTWDDYG